MDNSAFDTPSLWQGEYSTIEQYYKAKYPSPYYEFDKHQLEIDPDETLEDFNKYDEKRQRLEFTKCAMSFQYFATKYVRIVHPKKGLIPFIVYKYQLEVIAAFEGHRFNIISKFRQGGLTTLAELWGMWRCMFKLDQRIALLSKTDAEAVVAGSIINTAVKHLPTWLQPPKNDGKWNDHEKSFPETGGLMRFGTPERARGLSVTYLILDEAAFIPEMEKHWKAMYPTLSTGGNCIVISTVNGYGNWYEKMYHQAEKKRNKFHVIDLDFDKHPEYNKPEWIIDQKAQLGEKGWRQEVLRDFLGSGDTYIPGDVLINLTESTRLSTPKRKSFLKWLNGEARKEEEEDMYADEEIYKGSGVDKKFSGGALWLWKEPQDGHEYIIGVDASEGIGEDGDNSCLEVFDQGTLEQVAEFYSNCVPAHIFAQIINEVGIYFNNAMLVVENMGHGSAVLSTLENVLFYEHLYYDNAGRSKTPKAGWKTTMQNRAILLENLQQRLINRTVRINSTRLVKEFNTLLYNPQTSKIEAQKGEHDDAIMACCLALHVRDTILRDIPMGADVPQELKQPFKSSIYEEIRREILEGAPRDFLSERSPDPILLPDDEDIMAGVVYSFRRKYDRLLREFGWTVIPFGIISYDKITNLVILAGNFFGNLL